MNRLKRRWLWILISVFLAIIPLGLVTLHALNEADKGFKESKWVRTTSGTVLRKELFRCSQPACAYIGYGGHMEIKNGETQKRVYFEIDNFDQVGDARRSKAVEREKELVRMYGPRSVHAVDWYDRVEPGAKLSVRYRCFSDGQIELIGVDAKSSN